MGPTGRASPTDKTPAVGRAQNLAGIRRGEVEARDRMKALAVSQECPL